jgi:hypothetical protein
MLHELHYDQLTTQLQPYCDPVFYHIITLNSIQLYCDFSVSTSIKMKYSFFFITSFLDLQWLHCHDGYWYITIFMSSVPNIYLFYRILSIYSSFVDLYWLETLNNNRITWTINFSFVDPSKHLSLIIHNCGTCFFVYIHNTYFH